MITSRMGIAAETVIDTVEREKADVLVAGRTLDELEAKEREAAGAPQA